MLVLFNWIVRLVDTANILQLVKEVDLVAMVTRDIFYINEVNLKLIKHALNDMFYMLETLVGKTELKKFIVCGVPG